MGADFSKMFAQKGVTTIEEEGEEVLLPTICDSTTSPTLGVPIQNRYTELSTAVNYAYRINGGTWTASNGASLSIAGDPGTIIDIELAPDNTSFYGESRYGYVMPCKETPQLVMEVSTVATNSMTSTVWNDDGSVNSGTQAQALGTGENPNLELRLKGEKDKDYGDPYDGDYNILVCPYNNTVFDSISITGLSTTDVPDQVSLSAGNFYDAWKVPILESNTQNNGQGLTYTMTLDTDDTNQPTVAHNITCTLYDPQTFWDGTSGVLKYETDVEDETNADLGIATEETFTIYTS